MKAHPAFGDSLIAGVLLLFDMGIAVTVVDQGVSFSAYIAVTLLMLGPMPFRRYHPLGTSYLILAGGFLQLFSHGGINGIPVRMSDFALAIALYTLVAYTNRKTALIYVGWLVAGTLLWAIFQIGELQAVFLVFLVFVIFGFSWAMGEFIGARRAYQREMEQRLVLLETERDQQAKIAVGEERSRIARELHDIVAHAVSVMIVHADGAAYTIRSQPEVAENAVRTIADTGRLALTEMRRLLGVLRSEEAETQWAPQPDARGVVELAENTRAAGVPVRLEINGDVDDLPVGVGLSVYRIVQEALTNTIKHAGAGTTALVRLARTPEELRLEVTDNGFGTPHDVVKVSGGNGLIGMRERAAVLGGEFEAGPNPGGGWRVRATFPLAA
ncbi:Signal transduction histidine kinase [Lentzea albidocapillata subsp. violacea]|uniref:histidine kinase n=2 Tax=Lentzea albidocapillata TaxID=40571 RepID=A0A1G9CY64_9PSEU|nr:sensor histidine kinase [Lentzea albidocapillata]SDK56601.1 Signal transduction histidine kinase [Lentzea albidocapillata subsp. violacea]